MKSLWANPPARYALIIVLLVLFSLLVRQPGTEDHPQDLLFTILVVALLVMGVALLIRPYLRGRNS